MIERSGATTNEALFFMYGAHKAVEQKRKYTGECYSVHPIDVYQTLLYDGGITDYASASNHNMLIAALLHDVLEDTGVSYKDIQVLFGDDVAELVNGLTDISKPEDGNRETRKRIDREHTARQSARCKTIKLADLISNTKSIVQHDKEFAKVYMAEKKLLLEVLQEGNVELLKIATEIVNNYYGETNGH